MEQDRNKAKVEGETPTWAECGALLARVVRPASAGEPGGEG